MRLHLSILAAIALAAVLGCGSDDSSLPIAALDPAAAPVEEASLSEPEPPAETPAVAKATAEYQPPFPRRRELFVPPANARRSVRRTGDGYEAAVELLGIARIDESYALLSIDGVATPLAEGATQSGVQVISIQPNDSVVLQRGRNRWTAPLE